MREYFRLVAQRGNKTIFLTIAAAALALLCTVFGLINTGNIFIDRLSESSRIKGTTSKFEITGDNNDTINGSHSQYMHYESLTDSENEVAPDGNSEGASSIKVQFSND